VREDYPENYISREYFVEVQKAFGRLVDGHPEYGFTMRLVDTNWYKEAVIMISRDQEICDCQVDVCPDGLGVL
jgi:hypothetical protein